MTSFVITLRAPKECLEPEIEERDLTKGEIG
jgi:hypothetical protein